MSNGGETQAPTLFRLWIRKGKPFTVQPPHNPPVSHDGGTTAAHLVLPEDAAVRLVGHLESLYGCEVDLLASARQTAPQAAERALLLGQGENTDRVWPSTQCPECAWFDPLRVEPDVPCGLASWPPETVTSLKTNGEKPQQDADACPVPHLWRT